MEKTNEFETILDGLAKSLRTLGIKEQVIWGVYYRVFCSIRNFHYERGKRVYDESILAEYENAIEERFLNDDITRGYRNMLLKCCERVREYVTTGDIQWKRRSLNSHTTLNERHEEVLHDFLSTLKVAQSTLGDISWSIRKYLVFLESRNTDFDKITINDIREFYVFCSKHLTKNSMHNIQCYLRKFHQYMEQNGIPNLSDAAILNSSIPRSKKVFPALTWDEYNAILAQIDTHTSRGKRDYAIFTLAAATGIRGIDIVRLKLKDIDWVNGVINVYQHKTNNLLTVPLTKTVGNAIKDYILNARPKCENEYVFISTIAPTKELKDSVTLNYLIKRYQEKTGLPKENFVNKAFHSIRRMTGTSMVLSDVPITLASQVLGHQNMQTIQRYISLDTKHLKQCALDFKGIESTLGGADNE